MKILTDEEEKEAVRWFREAAGVAVKSLCLRRKCGSVVVKNGKIIGAGFNSPPQNKTELRICLDEYEIPAGFRHDRTCCVHAEQRAISEAVRGGEDMNGARIYFADVDSDGNMLRANTPKCTICSRAALDVGIAEFYLYGDDGVRSYPTDEYNRLSYEHKTPRLN